jgi:hypothetical protein
MRTLKKARIVLVALTALATTSVLAQPQWSAADTRYGQSHDQRIIREMIIDGRLVRTEPPIELRRHIDSALPY